MAELSSFHDELFPTAISFGATGGPERRIEIVALASGHERRNARTGRSRRRYDAGTGVRSLDDLYAVMSFFEARRGPLHAFRFRDPFDWKSCGPNATPARTDQVLGTGDGTTLRFRLVKTYGAGGEAEKRPIARPVAGTLLVGLNGAAANGWSFDTAAKEIVFAAPPAAGAVVSAGYEFDVPVRFDAERLEVSLTAFRAGQIPAIPLQEVLL